MQLCDVLLSWRLEKIVRCKAEARLLTRLCHMFEPSSHRRRAGLTAAFRPVEFTKDALIFPVRILHRFVMGKQKTDKQAVNTS